MFRRVGALLVASALLCFLASNVRQLQAVEDTNTMEGKTYHVVYVDKNDGKEYKTFFIFSAKNVFQDQFSGIGTYSERQKRGEDMGISWTAKLGGSNYRGETSPDFRTISGSFTSVNAAYTFTGGLVER